MLPITLNLNESTSKAKPSGLEVSWNKSRSQDFGGFPAQTCWWQRHSFSFTELGSVVHDSGLLDQTVNRRISLAAGAMNSLDRRYWRYRYIEGPSSVFQGTESPVLKHGNEILTILFALVSRLDVLWSWGNCWPYHVSNQLKTIPPVGRPWSRGSGISTKLSLD